MDVRLWSVALIVDGMKVLHDRRREGVSHKDPHDLPQKIPVLCLTSARKPTGSLMRSDPQRSYQAPGKTTMIAPRLASPPQSWRTRARPITYLVS